MLELARRTIRDAVIDLERRGLPTTELRRAGEPIEAASSDGGPEPYFIPNDLSLCTPRSVLNCSPIDRELDIPCGFSIEAAATRPHAFAKPYYIDPVAGNRRCKGLYASEDCSDRTEWTFDLSFVGHRGKCSSLVAQGLLVDTANTRFVFLRELEGRAGELGDIRLWLRFNDWFFFNPNMGDENHRAQLNSDNRYIESIRDSRFVLCPRGGGPNSIRFFETLACCNIPIFIGDEAARFPLDWIIDWNIASLRISCEQVADGSWLAVLRSALDLPLAEVNARRHYIFRIYHQFLAPERWPVFEQLVLFRAREMLRATETTT